MITFTRAYNLVETGRYVSGKKSQCFEDLHGHHVAWIGFVPERPSPINGFDNSLVLEMDDVAEDGALAISSKGIVFPTMAIAREIVEFVNRYARSSAPWAIAVHCTGGMSRSPAVTRWIWETYLRSTMPEDVFQRLHAHSCPNPVLLGLLRVAAREKEIST